MRRKLAWALSVSGLVAGCTAEIAPPTSTTTSGGPRLVGKADGTPDWLVRGCTDYANGIESEDAYGFASYATVIANDRIALLARAINETSMLQVEIGEEGNQFEEPSFVANWVQGATIDVSFFQIPNTTALPPSAAFKGQHDMFGQLDLYPREISSNDVSLSQLGLPLVLSIAAFTTDWYGDGTWRMAATDSVDVDLDCDALGGSRLRNHVVRNAEFPPSAQ